MKKTLFLLAASFFYLIAAAQDCTNYFYLQANKTIEMTLYNRKGDPNGKQVFRVSNVSGSGSGMTAEVESESFNKKGKSIAKTTGTYGCKNGVLLVDMKMNLPQQQSQQFKDAKAIAQDIYIEFPNSMKVGDALKDGNMEMEVESGGIKQTISMLVSERKVEAKETVTTTAGSWECFKIRSKSKITMKTLGVGIPISIESTDWYAPGFGVVKSENKNGSTAITSIK